MELMETAAVDPNPVIHPVPPVPDAPAGRDPALDGLRGFAILLITIYRFNGGATGGETADNSLLHFAALGMRGVDLLFVLSGYLITRMLVEARHDPHFFRNFYARRTLQIFPLYYGVLIAILVVLPLLNPRLGAIFSEHVTIKVGFGFAAPTFCRRIPATGRSDASTISGRWRLQSISICCGPLLSTSLQCGAWRPFARS